MNTVRRMKVHNFAEVRTSTNETFIIKFDNEVTKDDLNSLREVKNVKETFKDRIVTKKEYNVFLGKGESTKTRKTKTTVVNNEFIGARVNKEREEYLEDMFVTESEVINWSLDCVLGKKQIDGYYLPKETVAIARRVILNRPIWISGPSGCLTRNEKISIKVSDDIFNIIERNRKKE